MIADAKQMGTYHSEGWDRDFPKVQIAEIRELLAGKPPQLPPIYKKRGESILLDS
jgi:hypothetical protein